MPLPLLTKEAKESNARCSTCDSVLSRTGIVATFAETEFITKPWSEFGSKRGERRYMKGWLPPLLVTVCPVCDARKLTSEDLLEMLAEVDNVETTGETYLERIAREHDDKEGTDA